VQAQRAALFFCERGPFVQPLVVEKVHPARNIRQPGLRELMSGSHCLVSPLFAVTNQLTEKIDLCEVNDFVAPSAHNRFEQEKTEALGLLESNCWRHRKLLAAYDNLN